MKKSIFLVLSLYFLIISCNREAVSDDTSIAIGASEDTESSIGCIKYVNDDKYNISNEILNLGEMHNELLELVRPVIFIEDKCSSFELNIAQEQMDQAISANDALTSAFGPPNGTSIPNFYHDVVGLCMSDESSDDALLRLIEYTMTIGKDNISAFEQNFVRSFFTAITSSDVIIDLDPYLTQIVENSDEFILGGVLAYTTISIYEHSACYWLNTWVNPDVAQERIIPILAAAACWDAAGAMYEGIKHAINNSGTSGDGQILKDMGRGAANASVPLVGGDLFDWATS